MFIYAGFPDLISSRLFNQSTNLNLHLPELALDLVVIYLII